ncbi:STAS domain-containing protein [Sphingomonas yunnanensis]|uniref:STAS domain-containing protein n=1 Tax=Sphingomonas yunnanensis TaxID=310400 RepID=UPI001CA7AAC8|nr:STAS domain-containing protein [Sphingomonas yunnanensis]MBY9062038.1 STAS domain-containing protein [Sphingomonas yunnanensis]
MIGRDASISDIAAILDVLTTAIAEHAAVTIDLAAVTSADLSLLQLLESARREAARGGRLLSLATSAAPAIAALLDRAGFMTAATPADIEFWSHGALPR